MGSAVIAFKGEIVVVVGVIDVAEDGISSWRNARERTSRKRWEIFGLPPVMPLKSCVSFSLQLSTQG
ncbi:hypothetical protein Ddye_031903 [Dipteronia dyeriana]|uniref:Uncharacterized protein n=1 Tax=Dipteronia dyeriana TaxID=168575 RepID=A0AAD9WN13_9ROSI|nr:hypothetical protein Ddye_031903 [Dipteronia dyeriana]